MVQIEYLLRISDKMILGVSPLFYDIMFYVDWFLSQFQQVRPLMQVPASVLQSSSYRNVTGR